MCNPVIEKYGANPAHVQWTVVRGDTATLRVDFLQDDEVSPLDISNWTFESTSYDPSGQVLDSLQITTGNGYVIITATPDVTLNWGNTYSTVVAELPFDLQVTINDNDNYSTWTPVLGTICVLGDVTPGGSL